MATAQRGAPHSFVIFGATGDLTRRKLLCAYNGLCRRGLIAPESFLLGCARADIDDARFVTMARDALAEAGQDASSLSPNIYYHALGEADDYASIRARLEALEATHATGGNRIFYLALPAKAFGSTIRGLGEVGLNSGPGWTRLVIEKPFGTDLATAQALRTTTQAYFDESQVYLIDHYLGKETVQNLLAFRFANLIFESAWNRDRINNVQITVAEQLGVEGRAGYYDQSGALRDMVQNHMAQMLALVAMEVPSAYRADAIRFEKTKLLNSVVPPKPAEAVFGQYGAGSIGGRAVPAYRDEPDVAKGSRTETYAAVRVEVANWRWYGVPFYLRSGKRLARRVSEIAIAFRHPPACLFKTLGIKTVQPNVLRLTLQPNEGLSLHFNVKTPGSQPQLQPQPLQFQYEKVFGQLPEAYETLLADVIAGDQSLFAHTAGNEASWELFAPLISGAVPVHDYAAGSWGPKEANGLLRPGHQWLSA